ncbi:hypothetical protein AS156_35920 [Bradyrhizobium macuxiense]|uniref:Uncharacterized protein n=1 Tax=Bradyrhizobium macuxiense TaxID=1755647 RepID=A0A109JZV1_9BRAD|nr:hypothetical protein AS156_35920 [Bradyrhizobium macuxiense]
MLDDEFNRQRARLVRDLADRADPFIKRRLLDLASRYEQPRKTKPLVLPPINVKEHLDRGSDG